MPRIFSNLEVALSGRPNRLSSFLRGGRLCSSGIPGVNFSMPAKVGDYLPALVSATNNPSSPTFFVPGAPFCLVKGTEAIKRPPLNVGYVYSGGCAAGGHNAAAGIIDTLEEAPGSQVIAFRNGANGLIDPEKYPPIFMNRGMIDPYRNTGGFDLSGSSRTKLEKPGHFRNCLETIVKFGLSGLLFIGGDDSGTNAAFLTNAAIEAGINCKVIVIPKTMDNDFRRMPIIPVSFGFHTATATYAGEVGAMCIDASSLKKTWEFVRFFGRAAGHVVLEVGLQTHPNIVILREDIEKNNWDLQDVVNYICGIIKKRLAQSPAKNYGVCAVAEGVAEAIPEVKKVIREINRVINQTIGAKNFKDSKMSERREKILTNLGETERNLFLSFPFSVQSGLLEDLDPNYNLDVGKIPSEELLCSLVRKQLENEGIKITTVTQFLSYEGRCIHPTWFDADYTYNLGVLSIYLMWLGYTGCVAGFSNIDQEPENWQPVAMPLSLMMTEEVKGGKNLLVIAKALMNTGEQGDPAYLKYLRMREKWALEDDYRNVGPIQYFGPTSALAALLCDGRPITTLLDMGVLKPD